jgi:Uma2 family endonuclease
MSLQVKHAKRYRFNVDEYYRMADAGVFDEDCRVELVEGDIIEMPPPGPEHNGDTDKINYQLMPALGTRAIVRNQGAVRLGQRSEPLPDFALLRWRDDFYRTAHPVPSDIYLIIEVAKSSVKYDTQEKALLYAMYNIPEYWVVNIPHRSLLVFRDPSPEGYREVRELTGEEAISPLAFPDVALTPELLLP